MLTFDGGSFSAKKETESGEIDEEKKIEEALRQARENIETQPESVQKILADKDIDFAKFAEINGYNFLFTGIGDGEVLSLVQEQKTKLWKTRLFRFSGSDHQWKGLPGFRPDGVHLLKGDEANENHHYVQSAKLDKQVYQSLDELPGAEGKYKWGYYDFFAPIADGEKKEVVLWLKMNLRKINMRLKIKNGKNIKKIAKNVWNYIIISLPLLISLMIIPKKESCIRLSQLQNMI